MNNRYKSGTIYSIKLPFELGYAYAKLINFLEHAPDGLLIKVYDLITPTLLEKTLDFSDNDLLFGPNVLIGLPQSLEKIGIKKIGFHIEDSDFNVPDFKQNQKMMTLEKKKLTISGTP